MTMSLIRSLPDCRRAAAAAAGRWNGLAAVGGRCAVAASRLMRAGDDLHPFLDASLPRDLGDGAVGDAGADARPRRDCRSASR